MRGEWQVQITDLPGRLDRAIYIFRETGDGRIDVLGQDATATLGAEVSEPTITLRPEQLQSLADALDRVGYKPQKGFVEGKLSATEHHLEDLRQLLKLKRS